MELPPSRNSRSGQQDVSVAGALDHALGCRRAGRTQIIIAREALSAGFDLYVMAASELVCAVIRLAIGPAARGV